MTRLDPPDPDGKDFDPSKKTTTQMGRAPEEIADNLAAGREDVDLGPMKTAASYGDRVKARQAKTQSVKGKGRPLGGATPLDPKKMAQLRDSMAPRPDFGEDMQGPRGTQEAFRPPKEPPVGVGASYGFNQDISSGKTGGPVSLSEAKKMTSNQKQLSAESVKAIEMANEQLQKEEEQKVEDTTAAELEEATEEMLQRTDSFDFHGMNEARKTLMSKERRKSIEDRLEDLDISDMVVKREVSQVISIVPGKLSVTLRTFSQTEALFCMQYVYEYPGSALYTEELLNTCKLVCALVALNGARLPDHRKGVGTSSEEVDMELFKKKMFHVSGLPALMVADFTVQAVWFEQRINRLFSYENLKNG